MRDHRLSDACCELAGACGELVAVLAIAPLWLALLPPRLLARWVARRLWPPDFSACPAVPVDALYSKAAQHVFDVSEAVVVNPHLTQRRLAAFESKAKALQATHILDVLLHGSPSHNVDNILVQARVRRAPRAPASHARTRHQHHTSTALAAPPAAAPLRQGFSVRRSRHGSRFWLTANYVTAAGYMSGASRLCIFAVLRPKGNANEEPFILKDASHALPLFVAHMRG